jgi:uncharacterized protein
MNNKNKKTMVIKYLVLFVALIVSYASNTYAASFDCLKASTAVERMICADPEVSKLDEDLNVKYKEQLLKATKSDLIRQRQHYWLKKRNSCNNIGCINIYYHKRIAELIEREKELKDLRLKLEIPKYSKDESPAFCTRLLDSIKRWEDVTILAPIVTANTIDDPMLRKHFKRCDPLKFIKSVEIEPRIWNANNLDSASEEEREGFGSVSIATKGFKLYQANINNDSANKEELILYGAGRRPEWSDDSDISFDLTYFNVIDTQQCRIVNSAQVKDVVNDENLSFVGLIKFENNI